MSLLDFAQQVKVCFLKLITHYTADTMYIFIISNSFGVYKRDTNKTVLPESKFKSCTVDNILVPLK